MSNTRVLLSNMSHTCPDDKFINKILTNYKITSFSVIFSSKTDICPYNWEDCWCVTKGRLSMIGRRHKYQFKCGSTQVSTRLSQHASGTALQIT